MSHVCGDARALPLLIAPSNQTLTTRFGIAGSDLDLLYCLTPNIG